MRLFLSITLLLLVLLLIGGASAQVVEIPDPNLKDAVRETLGLAADVPVTQQEMLRLTRIHASRRNITDLSGLEYTTHLKTLSLWGNPISDLSPLANLVELEYLDLAGCRVSDIAPLANLTQLRTLNLGWNSLEDISSLSNLIQLERLTLLGNRIIDFSPLDGLSLTVLERDEFCELPGLPVQDRIENRSFPSAFKAWHEILNRPVLLPEERTALHDLFWTPLFGLNWLQTKQGVQLAGNLDQALQERDTLLSLNPSMIFIRGIFMRDGLPNRFPEDWPYWIRDVAGNRVSSADDYSGYLVDFTHPEVQDMIVQQAVAVSKCGLYDGIFLDWWAEDWNVLKGYRTYDEEQRARDAIIQRVREVAGDDFLIIVNSNRRKPLRAGPHINGLFMETLRDHESGYTHDGLIEIESTLLWAEENLREPQINGLEGWGIEAESPDSPTNRRWMRVFTTMGLTHSDGYVLYITGIRSPDHVHDWSTFEPTHVEVHNQGRVHNHHHDHYWYNFWDADLGMPVGAKAQTHGGVEGLFIREFTNGWAVYNRSGSEQTITLPQSAEGVSSGSAGATHQLGDLDGEIYLKSYDSADVNQDGIVNVLDMVLVSNAFGPASAANPQTDVNRDGQVNVLDLVIISNHLRAATEGL